MKNLFYRQQELSINDYRFIYHWKHQKKVSKIMGVKKPSTISIFRKRYNDNDEDYALELIVDEEHFPLWNNILNLDKKTILLHCKDLGIVGNVCKLILQEKVKTLKQLIKNKRR